MPINYRLAKEDDLDGIVRFSKEQRHDESRPDFIISRIKNGVFAIAVDIQKKEIIGFRYGIRFGGDIFTTENFLISDEYRGQGIGSELNKFMIKKLKAMGYKIDILSNSDLYPPVKGAIQNGKWIRPTNFYKKLGYKLVAETDNTRLFLIDLTKVKNNN